MEVDAAVVELYGLPPEQFVAARNRLAKAVRDRGDEAAAAAIGALRKPTVAAWLANQLVRADPDGIHALTELGERLRQAYLTADSASRRELTRRRHVLVGDLVQAASRRAAGGRRVTGQTAERLTETLDAALVDPGAAQLLRTGQLTSALRHVGFGVVDENGDPARLAPIRPRVVRRAPPPAKAPAPRPAKRAAAPAAGRAKVDRASRNAEPRSRNASGPPNPTTPPPRPTATGPSRCSTHTSTGSATCKPTSTGSTTNSS